MDRLAKCEKPPGILIKLSLYYQETPVAPKIKAPQEDQVDHQINGGTGGGQQGSQVLQSLETSIFSAVIYARGLIILFCWRGDDSSYLWMLFSLLSYKLIKFIAHNPLSLTNFVSRYKTHMRHCEI